MTTGKTLLTIEDVEANPPPGRWELLDGEMVSMPPARGEHNWVMNRFDVRLTAYVEANDLSRWPELSCAFRSPVLSGTQA